MLREIPAGRKVSLKISRDGNVQTLAVELADRRAMEHDVWNKIGNSGDVFARESGDGHPGRRRRAAARAASICRYLVSSLNVGALVEPLTSQMAEYLGVPSGLMVKQVARKSEAAAAGLKAFDVILKVGPEAITTLSDWDRALHSNQGKPVQVTILRDKKQQTLTLQVDSKHHGAVDFEDMFPGECPLVAEIDSDSLRNLALESGKDGKAAAEALRAQADALRNELKAGGLEFSPQQAEEFRKQAENLQKSFKEGEFKIDQKQLDQMKQQMEELRKSFRPEEFKVDPKQMEQFKEQMDQMRLEFKDLTSSMQ